MDNTIQNQFHIQFETIQFCEKTRLTIPFGKIQKWSEKSEYLESLIKSNTNCENLVIDVSHVVNLETLLLLFKYFDNGFVYKVENNQKENLIVGLAYFGIDSNELNEIRKCLGLVYNLKLEDTQIHTNETILRTTINTSTSQECRKLDQQFLCTSFPSEHKESIYPSIEPIIADKPFQPINQMNSPQTVIELFQQETKNIFDKFPNCVVAGGKLLGYTTNQHKNPEYSFSDFDIFVLSDNQTEVLYTIRDLLKEIKHKFNSVDVLKTKYTITIYSANIEFQIIRKCYKSVTDILSDFDIDSCCIGILNNQLYALPRFHRSLEYKGNLLNPNRNSELYVERLVKYADRGMRIYVPGYNRKDPHFNKHCIFLARMFRMRPKIVNSFSKLNQHGYHFDIVKKYFRHHSRITSALYSNKESHETWEKSQNFDIDKTQFINNFSNFVDTVIQCNFVFCHSNIFEKTKFANSIYDDMYVSSFVH